MLPAQRQHAEDAAHGGLAVLGVQLAAEHADRGANAIGPPQQILGAHGRATGPILVLGVIAARAVTAVLTQQRAGVAVEDAHLLVVPLHVHGGAEAAGGHGVVGTVHGQMDPIMVASTLGAILLMPSLWSAVVLSIGIGLKSYPILLLPLFLLRVPGLTRKVFYAALATAPLLTLVPYWRQDAAAVRTFVLHYPGVIDQGWAAFFRYSPPNWWQWVWPNHDLGNTAVFNSKQWFWYPYAALLIWDAVTVLYGYANRLSAMVAGVYLLFYVVLGTISVQHLLWALPFFLIVWPRFALIYTVIATTTMFGEYTALNLAGIMYPVRWTPFFGQADKLKSLRRSGEEERWRSASNTVGSSRRRWCCGL
jgi:hypothetical protein